MDLNMKSVSLENLNSKYQNRKTQKILFYIRKTSHRYKEKFFLKTITPSICPYLPPPSLSITNTPTPINAIRNSFLLSPYQSLLDFSWPNTVCVTEIKSAKLPRRGLELLSKRNILRKDVATWLQEEPSGYLSYLSKSYNHLIQRSPNFRTSQTTSSPRTIGWQPLQYLHMMLTP